MKYGGQRHLQLDVLRGRDEYRESHFAWKTH